MSESETKSGGSDATRISDAEKWLAARFGDAGKEVPDFEYTPRSVSYLHNLITISEAKEKSAHIVAKDFRRKAAEYRSQDQPLSLSLLALMLRIVNYHLSPGTQMDALFGSGLLILLYSARIREILESVGLAQESLPSNVVGSAQVLANVSNLLNIRDTELSSFLVAMGDISLRKTGVEEKRAKVQKESKILLDFTRKAISRLTYLKRTLAQLEDDVAPCEAQMENWRTNLQVMAAKERQYLQQCANYKVMPVISIAISRRRWILGIFLIALSVLNRVGYAPEISHGMLVVMDEHRKESEKKTKPILETLRSYQDLPPVALAIEDKKRQYAAAEKYLEDVLHSALSTSE
uniref:Uncharacterized protein n=1 Tax=Quercus lobata TaxID=97700 RepID=A0A7N2R7C9_QUELO